jgi:hypothetical protein
MMADCLTDGIRFGKGAHPVGGVAFDDADHFPRIHHRAGQADTRQGGMNGDRIAMRRGGMSQMSAIFPWQLMMEIIAWPGKYENDGRALF